MRKRGLALLLVVGVLGILAVLAVAFVTLARLERRASLQRLYATKALLLARAGLEDALARLSAGQDPYPTANAYQGEDWDGNGALSAFEAPQEVFQSGALNVQDCPVRHAMRPSFFVRVQPALNPTLESVDGRQRGYTGILQGSMTPLGNQFALKVQDLNGRIFVNGGDLAAKAKDTANDGPNGFLLRLLGNLEVAVTGAPSPTLGTDLLSARPPGGYRRLEDLKAVLGAARYDQFKSHLTVHAWVDPSVARPQPMEKRPQRWMDVDATHQSKVNGSSLAGTVPTWSITGNGKDINPWAQSLTHPDGDFVTYNVRWEREFIYAWRQLRLGPVQLEPRAPVALNAASREVLAAALLGLKGTHLETWDGTAGMDGGWGKSISAYTYTMPPTAQEDVPWHRARADYGMPYGPLPAPVTGTDGNPRTWYGSSGYDPTYVPAMSTLGGRSCIVCSPLGRLRETPALSRDQALALADEILKRIQQAGPLRTWAQFNAFVDQLPRWEDFDTDADKDGVADPAPVLDGPSYTVSGATGFLRRRYEREDTNSDGVMNREVFTLASGGWSPGPPAWTDLGAAPLGAGQVPGLTLFQKDVVKAMANPNTNLNDFNPDQNAWKEVDKTDVVGMIQSPYGPVKTAQSFVHTTEFCLDLMGIVRLESLGRVLDAQGILKAQRACGVSALVRSVHRDTTQADFMKDYLGGVPITSVFSGPPTSGYPLAGGQPLLSYPEPQALAVSPDAAYDGRIGLGLVGVVQASPSDETIGGDLFGTLDASGSGDAAVPDVRGPFVLPLTGAGEPGSLFPDGVYSEKDCSLKYLVQGNINLPTATSALPLGYPTWDSQMGVYLGFWVKPNWFPEASPRPHALLSISVGKGGFIKYSNNSKRNSWSVPINLVPLDAIPLRPCGIYFVPGRNNWRQDLTTTYSHGANGGTPNSWPSRSLLWGAPHNVYITENLNRRGILNANGAWDSPVLNPLPAVSKPVGRLEAHRWVHVAVTGQLSTPAAPSKSYSRMILGRNLSVAEGGGWSGLGMGTCETGTFAPDHEPLFGPVEPNHIRFGEIAAACNLNHVADATFADIQVGCNLGFKLSDCATIYSDFFTGATAAACPATVGRYCKEGGATYTSPKLPAVISRPLRVTWTEIPCELWFDKAADGWLGDAADNYQSLNDQFGSGPPTGPGPANGLRDVRIDLEVWETDGAGYDVKRASYSDPAADNPLPVPAAGNRLYYKAVFVNEWDDTIRQNHPLDVTPFLDDVTVFYRPPGGVEILAWEEGE